MSQEAEPQKSVPLESSGQPLSPALKSWIDNVLVPAMVKIWLAEGRSTTTSHEQHEEGRMSIVT
jgi:hypothetical protein